MDKQYIFESKRLGFREWKQEDKYFFREMNKNQEVMKYFVSILNHEESDDFLDRIILHFDGHGYGLYAVEIKESKELIGFIGLKIATFYARFTPCIEIGWRIHKPYQQQGYGSEGAKRVLEYAFSELKLDKVLSFTSVINKPSIHIMKKIGLNKLDTFDHPNIKDNHPLKSHVLYGITKEEYEQHNGYK